MKTDQLAIHSAVERFTAAYNRGDIATLLSIFTADFVDMSHGERTLIGQDAHADTESRLRDTFAKFKAHLSIHTEELEVVGDRAFDRGTLRVELTPRDGGQPKIIERRFLEVWRKENGEWRVARGMDNIAKVNHEASLDFRSA